MRGDLPISIERGLLVDGTGAPARLGSLLVVDGRIARLEAEGPLPQGCRRFDAAGLVVSPGFIDAHGHDDSVLLEEGGMRPKLSQGVTAVVAGNCGIALAPLRLGQGEAPPPPLNLLGASAAFAYRSHAEYFRALRAARDGRGPELAAAVLGGHSALRVAFCADWRAPASPAELAAMLRALEEGFDAGLAGFSSGLAYATNRAAPRGEASALAAAAARRGKPFAIHIRDEYKGMWGALDEAIAIARESGAVLILSHQKLAGPGNRGRAQELLERIDRASRDVELYFDAYPYEAGSTVLEPESVRQSRRVVITWSEARPDLAGLDLDEATARLGLPRDEAIAALQPAGAIYFHMDERDVAALLSHPRCMLGSDGLPRDERPHPRLYGAFARFLGVYVRERGILGLPEAVRKMTSLPAKVFGLEGRGVLREGAWADIAVWDPATIADRATWEEPRLEAAGVNLVLTEGREAFRAAEPSGSARALP